MTVHILDDTPAVLSRKLCEKHGYTCEWASGQKPHLTKKGKIPVQNGKISFLLSQDCHIARAQVRLPHRYRRTHPSPARLRSDDTHAQASGNRGDPPKIQNKHKMKGNNQATRSRLRDLPEWLKDFTDNLEDTEVPGLANTSQDSDSERPTKVATRKHSIYTHFPKDHNREVCLRTKMTRPPCRRRTGEAVVRAEKIGDVITADHKVLHEGGGDVSGIAIDWITGRSYSFEEWRRLNVQ